MANGKWQMTDGRWQMTDDERRGDNGGLSPSAICHRALSSLWPTPGRCLRLVSSSLRSKQARNDAEPPHASPACPGRVPASGSGFPGARDDRTWRHDVFSTRLAALAATKERGINHHETPPKNLRMSRGAGPDGPVHELLARRRQRMGLALRRHIPERLDQGRR